MTFQLFRLTLASLFLLSCMSKKPPVEALPIPAKSQKYKAQVDAIGQQMIEDRWMIGLSIALIHPEGIEYYGYGRLHKDQQQVPDEHSIFEIGSISKVFTSLLLADAVNEKSISLQAPLEEWSPEGWSFPSKDGQKINALHLSTHSSGLARLPVNFSPRNHQNPYADYTPEHLKTAMQDSFLLYKPGEKIIYSNVGAGLLGYLLTQHHKKTYQQLLSEKINHPLQLKSTSVLVARSDQSRRAQGHDEKNNPTPDWDSPGLIGTGEINSTSHDLSRFLIAQLYPPESRLGGLIKMTHQERIKYQKKRVAMAWHIGLPGAENILWHSGGTGGFRSMAAFDPTSKIGLVVLSNNTSNLINQTTLTLLGMLQGKKEKLPIPKLMKLTPEILNSYTGEYIASPTMSYKVTPQGDRLSIKIPDAPPLDFYPYKKNAFFSLAYNIRIFFEHDETGKPVALIKEQKGKKQKALKKQ